MKVGKYTLSIALIRFATLALMLGAATQAVGADGGADVGEPDHAGHPTQIVGIVTTRLLPTVLVVPAGSAFGWLNYSSVEATIEFQEDIIPKLTCKSPGPFRSKASHLASPRVASGAFVTLCNLAPGEYDYRVRLEGHREPLVGKIVVESQS